MKNKVCSMNSNWFLYVYAKSLKVVIENIDTKVTNLIELKYNTVIRGIFYP